MTTPVRAAWPEAPGPGPRPSCAGPARRRSLGPIRAVPSLPGAPVSSDDLPFERAEPDAVPDAPREGPGFRTTLIRVMLVQVVALILLWVLQARYHAGG